MTPAIEKMERRLAALDARIDAALLSPEPLPADWEMMVMRSADMVERIVAETQAVRKREEERRCSPRKAA